MTENDWLTSDDPPAMLAWLAAPVGGAIEVPGFHGLGERKLRLFACACERWCCLLPEEEIMALEGAALIDYVLHVAACRKNTPGAGAQRAALLRDVVGNPWRPAGLAWIQDRPVNRELQPP